MKLKFFPPILAKHKLKRFLKPEKKLKKKIFLGIKKPLVVEKSHFKLDFTGLESNGLSFNDDEQNLNLFIHVLPPKLKNWGNNRFFQCSAAFNRCSWRRPTDSKLKIWTFLSLNDKFLRLRLRLDDLDKKPWSYHLELYKYILY